LLLGLVLLSVSLDIVDNTLPTVRTVTIPAAASSKQQQKQQHQKILRRTRLLYCEGYDIHDRGLGESQADLTRAAREID